MGYADNVDYYRASSAADYPPQIGYPPYGQYISGDQYFVSNENFGQDEPTVRDGYSSQEGYIRQNGAPSQPNGSYEDESAPDSMPSNTSSSLAPEDNEEDKPVDPYESHLNLDFSKLKLKDIDQHYGYG